MASNTQVAENAEHPKTPTPTPVAKSNPIPQGCAKNSKKGRINTVFQKDPEDEDTYLVPIENIKNSKVSKLKPQSVVELSNAQITTTKYVSEETRQKRVEAGKRLAEFRKNKLIEDAKLKKEMVDKEEDDRQQRIKEEIEAHKKAVEQKILEGKLVRVKVKEKKEYNTKNKSRGDLIKDVIKIPKRKIEVNTDTEDVTDTDTDVEEVKNKTRKFKKVQKTIDKKIEEIKKIDETINQYKNPYLDKLMSLMK
jgi:hypothetical protein